MDDVESLFQSMSIGPFMLFGQCDVDKLYVALSRDPVPACSRHGGMYCTIGTTDYFLCADHSWDTWSFNRDGSTNEDGLPGNIPLDCVAHCDYDRLCYRLGADTFNEDTLCAEPAVGIYTHPTLGDFDLCEEHAIFTEQSGS